MRIAISQPGYLPWGGFFDLIDQVDRFVLLDDAQFVRQSWDQRNRIKTSAGLQWLTVPVVFRGRLGEPLCDVMIRDGAALEKHLRSIEVNYGRAKYFSEYFPCLKQVIEKYIPGGRLIDLNIDLIEWLASNLSVKTPIVRSSSLGIEGKRSARLVSMCQKLGATDYLSPRSALYLLDDLEMFREKGLSIWFQNYVHPTYSQRFSPFVPYASVIDLLFNEGAESGTIMRSGRGQSFTPDQIREMEVATEARV
ncbi:MAG TPA: WbqC family protein [Terriglobales bacterium]|nr:WbqC family protein [Terriglobales bacterium]